jgi:hypothetical protein
MHRAHYIVRSACCVLFASHVRDVSTTAATAGVLCAASALRTRRHMWTTRRKPLERATSATCSSSRTKVLETVVAVAVAAVAVAVAEQAPVLANRVRQPARAAAVAT